MKELSIIVPCHNEEEALPAFFEELYKYTKDINGLEILLIDDGSKDGTLSVMKELAAKDSNIKYYSFSRNFGKEAAMYAGLCNATGEHVVIMDADLQDPPSLLPEMLETLKNEDYDSVATRRVNRKGEPPIRSFFARRFYRIMNKLSDSDVVDGARDYRMMKRKMVDAVISMREYNRFTKGIFGWVGFKTKWIEFENRERVAGETNWSFWGLFRYALDGIINFSEAPLSIASYLGLVMTFVAFLAVIFIFVRRLAFGDPVAGWASTACIITFVSGLQLFCLGIMGKYMAKMYLETKHRPVYIIRETNAEENER